MEISVDSLEDMCALMCDNVIPRNKKKKGEVKDNGKKCESEVKDSEI